MHIDTRDKQEAASLNEERASILFSEEIDSMAADTGIYPAKSCGIIKASVHAGNGRCCGSLMLALMPF